jgi:hypothetical protein
MKKANLTFEQRDVMKTQPHSIGTVNMPMKILTELQFLLVMM